MLRILRPLASGGVIAVFGSAGERDPTKRPAMGRASAELADVTIVTDEDPRLEDPRLINDAIAEGARGGRRREGETLFVIDDRPTAIGHAIGLARAGDVILLAGKGHEDDHLRRRGALVGREGGRATRPARRRLRWNRCLSSAPGASPSRRLECFIENAAYRSFPQLWEWGELREPFGWRPVRLAIGLDPAPHLAGAQVLIRDVPLVKWRLGYAPRGPVGNLDDPAVRAAMTSALRALARDEDRAIKVDPEAPDSPFGQGLLDPPGEATRVQPPRTRLIDLGQDDEALRGAMKRKHRQYVAKAEREGITVEHMDGGAFKPIADRGWTTSTRSTPTPPSAPASWHAPAATTNASGTCSPPLARAPFLRHPRW